MTAPADLAPLRALVEAVAQVPEAPWDSFRCLRLIQKALPAAREALERVEANSWLAYKEDMATVKQEHWLRIQALQARLARLEEEFRELARVWHELAPQCTQPFKTCGTNVCREARRILEGRDE